jgi:hypothetical protein
VVDLDRHFATRQVAGQLATRTSHYHEPLGCKVRAWLAHMTLAEIHLNLQKWAVRQLATCAAHWSTPGREIRGEFFVMDLQRLMVYRSGLYRARIVSHPLPGGEPR